MYEQHVYTLSCVSYGPFVAGNYGPCVTDNSCFQVAFCQQLSPNFRAKNGSQCISIIVVYCFMFKNFMVVVEPVMAVLVQKMVLEPGQAVFLFQVDQDELLVLVLGPF